MPKPYKRRDKHLHGLKSWAMYLLVVHRISLHQVEVMLDDCFGLRVGINDVLMIRDLMAKQDRRSLLTGYARFPGYQAVLREFALLHPYTGRPRRGPYSPRNKAFRGIKAEFMPSKIHSNDGNDGEPLVFKPIVK